MFDAAIHYNSTGHTFVVDGVVTPATLSADGSMSIHCKDCSATKSKTTIYKVSTVNLSATSYTYNGKVKTPSVTVKDSKGNTLKKDTDYTVSYSSGRKNVGKYTVTIKGKGKYSFTKKLTFKINPAKTSLKSLSAGSKAFTVKWTKKTTQVTGYQIQYSTSSKFTDSTTKTVTIKKNSTTSKTIKKLKAKKKYYVRVRTYKTVDGTKYYSSWSDKKSVTTKK